MLQAKLFLSEIVAPARIIPKVKARLRELALERRVSVPASDEGPRAGHGEGVTRWVRDIMFVGQNQGMAVVLPSLAPRPARRLFEVVAA